MDCDRTQEVLFLFADDELEAETAMALQRHLDCCVPCAQKLVYTQRFLALIRQRCIRQPAPRRLRSKILKSLPHRQSVLRL